MNKLCLLVGPEKWLVYENVKDFKSEDGKITLTTANGLTTESTLPYVLEYKKTQTILKAIHPQGELNVSKQRCRLLPQRVQWSR